MKKIIPKFGAPRLIDDSLSYEKLNREATVYRKLNLTDWFATKHYPERILWIQFDVKRNGSSCMMVLSTHSYNYKTL